MVRGPPLYLRCRGRSTRRVAAARAGQDCLRGVVLASSGRTGNGERFVPCDTVVFTGDWIPDHELARRSGAAIDPGTRGPSVDTSLETSLPRVFAAGNLAHAAETADIAAATGRHAAAAIAAALTAVPGGWPSPGPGATPGAALTVVPGTALTVVPGTALTVAPGAGPDAGQAVSSAYRIGRRSGRRAYRPRAGRRRAPARLGLPQRPAYPGPDAAARPFPAPDRRVRRPGRFEVRQDGRLLASVRHGRLVPAGSIPLTAAWIAHAAPASGPIQITLA